MEDQGFLHHLLDANLIRYSDYVSILEWQDRWRTSSLETIQSLGLLPEKALFESLAVFLSRPFIDLRRSHVDAHLIHPKDAVHLMEDGMMPFSRVGGRLQVAISHGNITLPHMDEPYDIWIATPSAIRQLLYQLSRFHVDEIARRGLLTHKRELSARANPKRPSTRWRVFLLCVLSFITIAYPHMLLYLCLWFANLCFLGNMLFKTLLLGVEVMQNSHDQDVVLVSDVDLPIYSILIPLRHEAAIIPQLIRSLKALDYPTHKLDILFLVDDDDSITPRMIKKHATLPASCYQIISVPCSSPQTKSRVCNVGLYYARGRYVCIFDAEDVPDPKQLRHMASLFACLPANTACIQARLNYYNRDENLLSRWFAIEYSWWFDFMLGALQKLDMPTPLGGTSNHFRVGVLRGVRGWDPYNVTEDADLGIRLARAGYRVHVTDMRTLEESPIDIRSWLCQRTRWIKGYFQTYQVHMRSFSCLKEQLGWKGLVGVQCFVGLQSLSFLVAPLLWLGFFVESGVALRHLMSFNLCFSLVMLWGVAAHICSHHNWKNMSVAILLFPLYWCLHSIAAFRAAYQLMVNPFFWEKTVHGKTSIKPCAIVD